MEMLSDPACDYELIEQLLTYLAPAFRKSKAILCNAARFKT